MKLEEDAIDEDLTSLSKVSLLILLSLVAGKIAVLILGLNIEIKLIYIALLASAPIVLFSRERLGIIKRIDWTTLVFFASLFIMMESVRQTGFFQAFIRTAQVDITSNPAIISISILLSQILSNVPLVALYLPLLTSAGATTEGMIALAAGSTIAGNMTIIGAASNVIILQSAEKRSNVSIGFTEFLKIGAPLTVLNAAVYMTALTLF